MKFITPRSVAALGMLLLAVSFPGQAQDSQTKLGDIVNVGRTGLAPNGYYYINVVASPDSSVPLPPNTCVHQSFWTFVKRFFGATPPSASAMLTVTVTPQGAPGQALTIPVYSTVAKSISSDGTGSDCQTNFVARPLTFTFNSNVNPKFTVDMAFHLTNETKSTLVTNVLSDANTLGGLMKSGSSTPGALATYLANPAIRTLASNIDSAVSSNWSNSNDLKYSTVLDPGADGGQAVDLITFKMPYLTQSGGGTRVGDTWNGGGTISLVYSHEMFKSSTQWQNFNTVLTKTVVPSAAPGAQANLYDIVLNGTATGGFKLSGLNSASTADSLNEACGNLERFLARFLIPSDALVARFAILKGSPYEKLPTLRANSSCFTMQELDELKTYRSDYIFYEQPRESAAVRQLNDKMYPITSALLLQNPQVIANQISSPPTGFYVALGKGPADYFHGQTAIDKLSQIQIRLSCYQARANNDLSSIAALASFNDTTSGAIISFDANNKLASFVLMSPDDVVSATQIDKSTWLSAIATTPTCAPLRPS